MSLAHHTQGILELEIPPLKRDGVVEEELRSVFETLWESIHREVSEEWIRSVGKQEGNILGSGPREEGGESGEGIVDTGSDVRDGAIGKDENGSGGIDMALDLSYNALPLECVLLEMMGVGEPRCVENANLGKMISLHTMFEIPDSPLCRSCS